MHSPAGEMLKLETLAFKAKRCQNSSCLNNTNLTLPCVQGRALCNQNVSLPNLPHQGHRLAGAHSTCNSFSFQMAHYCVCSSEGNHSLICHTSFKSHSKGRIFILKINKLSSLMTHVRQDNSSTAGPQMGNENKEM